MLTKDDLHAIGELLKPINEKLDLVVTKQDVKELIEANNKILGTIVRTEIAAATHKLEGKIDKIAKRLDEQDDKIEGMKNDLHVSKN